jgi:hypothetical protein
MTQGQHPTSSKYDINAIRHRLHWWRISTRGTEFPWCVRTARREGTTSWQEDLACQLYEALHAAYGRQLWGKGCIFIDSPTVFDLLTTISGNWWLDDSSNWWSDDEDLVAPWLGEADVRPDEPNIFFRLPGVCYIDIIFTNGDGAAVRAAGAERDNRGGPEPKPFFIDYADPRFFEKIEKLFADHGFPFTWDH